MNDTDLVSEGGEDFPCRGRLTGAYYIARESYSVEPDPMRITIGIMCHCLEPPIRGQDHDGDYLGLHVWLKCSPERWSSFEVAGNTDSSSI